jgi:hypothetical protein
MKTITSSFLLAVFFLLPGLLRAEDFDPQSAIIGTWVIDDDASWANFTKSPEWAQMSDAQQVDFRASLWPKALEKLLFTAYHFSDGEIIIAHKENQMRIPARYADSGKDKLTVVMGTAPNQTTLTISFYNANQINIRSAGEVRPNYYVWKRRADQPK